MDALNNVPGRLLRAFLLLADTQQFKLASERMSVSQSAFSQMIGRLEALLGVRLFDRDTRNVALTAEGQILVPMVRRLEEDFASMQSILRDHAERRIGKVAVAALPSLCGDWLPTLLARFRQTYPGIALQLFDTVAGPTLELVRQGKVDFAVTARLDSPDEFETQLLFDEPFFLVCRSDHPLAHGKLTSLRKLKGCRYIHTTRMGSVWHWVEPHLKGAGHIDAGFEAGNLETLAALIENGFGVSVVPGFALDQFRRRGLATVPIDNRRLRRPLLMVKRRGSSLSIAAQELLDLIAGSPPQFVLAPAKTSARDRRIARPGRGAYSRRPSRG